MKHIYPLISILILVLLTISDINAQIRPTVSTSDNEVWYYVQMKKGEGVLQDMGDNANILTRKAERNKPEQLWKITGTEDKYTMTSQTGRTLNYSTSTGFFQASTSASIQFKLVPTGNTTYAPAWNIERLGGSGYMNQWGGAGVDKKLGEWNDIADPNNPLDFVSASTLFDEVHITGEAIAPDVKYALWYRNPATVWQKEALPIGNGQFGGMLFGGVRNDKIQFNDKTLWQGNKTTYGAYQNFGELIIKSLNLTTVSNYRRALDIENALATVEYDVDGVHYMREYFASNPDSAIVVHYTSSAAQKLNLEITLRDAHAGTTRYKNGNITIKGGLQLVSYFGKASVLHEGGTLVTKSDKIKVSDANTVTIILCGKTNYSPTSPTYTTPEEGIQPRVASIVDNIAAKSYEALKTAHVNDYKSLFDRVSLRISKTENEIPTDKLLDAYSRGTRNPFLEELYFQWGRYLMIASARGIDSPSNLQGIWNNSNTPPWSSDIHSNINVQMNYWLAENTNLSELHHTFLNYIYNESMRHDQWKQNARDAGQTKGWTIYTENNIFGYHGSFMHNYVIANAWYAMHLWQHYRYTLDRKFLLEKAYPVMKSCAEFWMERLIDDKGSTKYGIAADGTLVCPNEYSPEHGPNEDGVAHAQQLVWDLFNNTLHTMRILGDDVVSDTSFKNELAQKFENLDPGLHIEEGGYLREWKYTPRTVVEDYSHRHMSHLVGLYPGNQISPLIDKTIFDAAVKALDSRGNASTGWSMGWKINLWARALNGNRAYQILNLALTKTDGENYPGAGGVYTNLFDAHPPFQIDGNFGATAGIAEMLLQSHIEGIIQVLPALPDAWQTGEVKGLRAVGNYSVDIKWENGAAQTVAILSEAGGKCQLHYTNIANATIWDAATDTEIIPTIENANQLSFSTVAGGKYSIKFGEKCNTSGAYVAVTVPSGKMQAENYDYGCEGVGFHAVDNVNSGAYYRNDGIDIYQEDGRAFIDLKIGEWVAYTVQVKSTGKPFPLNAILKGAKGSEVEIFVGEKSKGTYTLDRDIAEFKVQKLLENMNFSSGKSTIKFLIKSGSLQIDAFFLHSYFVKNILSEGNYKIVADGRFLTNKNPHGLGGKPLFISEYATSDGALNQVWTVTLDNGFYKIVSASDARYLNEQGSFGTNPYYADWNTYNIYFDEEKYAIQNTQHSGNNYWQLSENTIVQGADSGYPINFVFEFIPYNSSSIEQDVHDNSFRYRVGKNKVVVESSRSCLKKLELISISGKIIAASIKNTIDISSLAHGVYFLRMSTAEGQYTIVKLLL